MTGGERKPAVRVLVAIALAIAVGGAVVLAAGALAALPALFAFLPLFAGRYLGADRLEALIERRRARARRAKQAAPSRFRVDTFGPRGGQLLAFALAERGPPAPAAS